MSDTGLDEELSIDSNTDKKIRIESRQECCRLVDEKTIGNNHDKTKPHFRIDWRQLTYYKKERRSLIGQLCNRRPDNQLAANYAPTDEDNDSAECSPAHSYLEAGRLSRTSSAPSSGRHGGKHRPILNSLDGCFKSGELSAILGPSGAGKSTFLSALFGNKQESSFGQTKVTWLSQHEQQQQQQQTDKTTAPQPVPSPNTKRPLRIAILPQQDHLLNHLSVYETLMFASKIKNPHKANCNSFHRSNVRRVAETLKLTECLQTRCGRLSGGQYKRVSIGQELLSEPDVIILDEPTSGLDAMTCLTTIRTLKSIVLKHPISIILTIHQPDIDVFNLFDKIYVIAQGGLAIYEGPPSGVVPTLNQVNLFMPSDSYNPARFIVENAFVAAPEVGIDAIDCLAAADQTDRNHQTGSETDDGEHGADIDELDLDDSASDEDLEGTRKQRGKNCARDSTTIGASFLRQSLSSLTGALAKGSPLRSLAATQHQAECLMLGKGVDKRFRNSGRQPLLNIGIQTADGKLITSDQLQAPRQPSRAAMLDNEMRRRTLERVRNLKRLNELQKERYYNGMGALVDGSLTMSDILSQQTSLSDRHHQADYHPMAGGSSGSNTLGPASPSGGSATSGWTEAREDVGLEGVAGDHQVVGAIIGESSTGSTKYIGENLATNQLGDGGKTLASDHNQAGCNKPIHLDELQHRLVVVAAAAVAGAGNDDNHGNSGSERYSTAPTKCESSAPGGSTGGAKLRRQFDKRLSAKRIQSKRGDHPIWYHSFLLTHRTWLSIVRDPVFFGIQFAMHTTIPILLALIFGSQQEEGCPRVGNFDLVEFAYADDRADFLQGTMRSIRKSIGNIGVVFFEMFVLSFAINCITALVFPLDMYVLLKEHRNGWYSLKSYFFGRTLADLPVPIVLHSMAMGVLCYMTAQPLAWWRFSAVIGIVILASLVAQSVGLTIGAILMRSSQSAVLAAAGIVAPFFALSGFIVRIHTLPWIAQWAAQGSYLYHLLNGFIIMRYGFGRCPCSETDFDQDEAHKIPGNIKTMASMWVGTYSNEFESSPHVVAAAQNGIANRTNIDPNIDIIDKLMGAFKMANSFGHKVESCNDVLPYAMLDFNLHDSDIWHCLLALVLMLLISRFITFGAIYYKIRSFS